MKWSTFSFLGFLFWTLPALAQMTTEGRIVGKVRDPSGAVLAGAQVTVSSPALQGSPVEVRASPTGTFRLLALPPGQYRLEVSAPGFQTYAEERIRVLVGGTIQRNVTLPLETVSEELTVSERGSLVDPRRVSTAVSYDSRTNDNVPRSRTGVMDFFRMAPGISPSPPGSQVNQVGSFGSGVNENVVFVDGIDRGNYPPFLEPDSIEEIEILTTGVPAEVAFAQGAVFNIVTRQGGNDWRFDASYYHQNDALTASSTKTRCFCPDGETGFTNVALHDTTAHIGGPLVPERLFLFAGYQFRHHERSRAGRDPRFPLRTPDSRFSQKLNWNVTPRLTLTQTFQAQSTRTASPPSRGSVLPVEALFTFEGGQRAIALARLQFTASDRTLFDLQVSRAKDFGEAIPGSGRETPFRFDNGTDTWIEGSLFFNEWESSRLPLSATITHFAEEFLDANHELKFGVQFVRASSEGIDGVPGGVQYYDFNGAPDRALFQDTSISKSTVRTVGMFAEDVLVISDRLTLSLGVRFDHSSSVSEDAPAVDNAGNPTGGVIRGLGDIFSWNVWSPRLGFTLRLDATGKTLLRGAYSRLYQDPVTQPVELHPGNTPATTASYDPATGTYSNIIFTFDPLRDLGIDPELRPASTDQFSIGIEHELGPDAALTASYIRKRGRDFTGWLDAGGQYGVATTTLPDGREITTFPLIGPQSDQFFLVTNPDGWFLDYDGLLLTFEKRWSRRWQTHLSYGFSRSAGLQASNIGLPGGSQFSVPTGRAALSGRDPNDLINAEGRLAGDRPHMLRALGIVEIPKIDVLVSGYFQYVSGQPWAAQTRIRLPQGRRWILLEPPGSRLFPAPTLLDVRVSKFFQWGETQRLEVLLDLLNALNQTTVTNVISHDLFNPNFGVPRFLTDPRTAMIGVKVTF